MNLNAIFFDGVDIVHPCVYMSIYAAMDFSINTANKYI